MARKRTTGAVVLSVLKKGTYTTADLFVNVMAEPFRHSYKGGPAPLRGKNFSIRDLLSTLKDGRDEQRKFYNLLSNLKRDGLITKNSNGAVSTWFISKKGVLELDSCLDRRYNKRASKEVVVISYDIPEKFRKERDWLRSILRFLDYKMLHQSIWIGKTEIPDVLVKDLHDRKISEFVHMFTIGKEGSLTQVL